MLNTLKDPGFMKKEQIQFLKYLLENGGPKIDEYPEFTQMINNLDTLDVDNFRKILEPALDMNTLIGHGLVKPYGYPGDFELINMIYNNHVNENIKYRNWDIFFQNQAGAQAVRNRKNYFVDYCNEFAHDKKDFKVLILGSGPASDVHEFLKGYEFDNITFDLIDYDQNAINFSKKITQKYNHLITYHRINVLRYKPYKLYDLIWSAGLFDYFKDKHFVFLIRKFKHWLSENGEFVISNFSTENPTRLLMEVLSDWYLNHRSESDLHRMALEAGISESIMNIDSEPLGVNLFLKIKALRN